MSKMMEDMRKEAAREKSLQMAKRLLSRGKDTYEEIAELTDLTVEEVAALDEKKSA